MACIICDEPDATGLACSSGHHVCAECFCRSLESACEEGGYFAASVARDGRLSKAGEMPCMKFPMGQCTVTSLPRIDMMRALVWDGTGHALQLFHATEMRVAVAQAAAAKASAPPTDPLLLARQRIETAMNEACSTPCPGCGVRCIKNDAWY